MSSFKMVVLFCILIVAIFIFSMYGTLSAQFLSPGSFGLTSVSNFSIYPSYPNYTGYAGYAGYPGLLGNYYPSYGNAITGGYASLGGSYGNPYAGLSSPYSNIMKAMQYYQYLTYAYQFYQIARSTPMYYMKDMTADYIGSALYGYIQNTSLSPQEAILGFITQYLLK